MLVLGCCVGWLGWLGLGLVVVVIGLHPFVVIFVVVAVVVFVVVKWLCSDDAFKLQFLIQFVGDGVGRGGVHGDGMVGNLSLLKEGHLPTEDIVVVCHCQ